MIWILVLAGILVYIALLFFSGPLLLLAGYLAALFVLAAVFLIYRRFCVDCGVEVPISVTDEGKDVSLQIHIKNKSPLTCGRIRLCLVVCNAFYGKKRRIWLKASDIMPGQNRLLYILRLPGAGCYDICVKGMHIYDLTGLAWIRKKVNRSARVQVLPDIQPVSVRLTEPVRSFFGDAEVYDEDRAGQDTDEVLQIRSFRPGDRLQSIHWKLSGKMNKLIVREFGRPVNYHTLVLLSPSFLYSSIEVEEKTVNGVFDLGVSLSHALLNQNIAHFVGCFDVGEIHCIPVDSPASY